MCQISTFKKVWTTYEGGPDNLGASFFEPTELPEGFSMLGSYCQPNNKPLFGWVLAAKNDPSASNAALRKPVDYTLVSSSESLNIKQDNYGYIWLPTGPDGYKAVGHVVTTSPEKPSLDRVRCVREDLTNQCETHTWIWGLSNVVDANKINVYAVGPCDRRTQAPGVLVGTFLAQNDELVEPPSIACLKTTETSLSSMPNRRQIEALVQIYSPILYFHPDELFLPSSVDWFFTNGALLYKKGEESEPVSIHPTGSNLPQGGSNDGAYWLDLPVDKANRERVKKGDLQSCKSYIHIKPRFGGTFTDISIWVFFPFNGPSRAKLACFNIPLGKIGEHVGDWEHVTLRISNFNGELWRVYFSQHSGGTWVDASQLEFQNGNKPVVYSSLHGHALYPKPGLVLQGGCGIGIRNDTAKNEKLMDMGERFEIVAGESLGFEIMEPPWLNYFRQWGPKIDYEIADDIRKVEDIFSGKVKSALQKVLRRIVPKEVLGEEGPTGPKLKRNWSGDERVKCEH